MVAGETLYSIALRYEKDYVELAELNQLDSRFTIRPGQRLRLRGSAPPRSITTSPRTAPRSVVSRPPPASREPARAPIAKKPSPVRPSAAEVRPHSPASSSLSWGWPAKGQLIGKFGTSGVTGKGLDIAGRQGDSVLAAASGVVVYAGSGLVGYGRLLIIRHDENYISAYAHNDSFLVKEGDSVKLGQAIAEMGASGADREKLHFEIRERGKPVDPLRFLPARE
ncbi:MAG: lipoprotein [Moraxellaceae bacterium]|nr:lipoprotein [Moraxellaceae bacterium]